MVLPGTLVNGKPSWSPAATRSRYGRWPAVAEGREQLLIRGREGGLKGEDVGSPDAVLPSNILLRSAAKAVKMGHNSYVCKTEIAQESHKLCLRQGAGDSTGP